MSFHCDQVFGPAGLRGEWTNLFRNEDSGVADEDYVTRLDSLAADLVGAEVDDGKFWYVALTQELQGSYGSVVAEPDSDMVCEGVEVWED